MRKLKTCYIFGAAKGLPREFTSNPDDLIIAADAGLKHLERLNIKPDIILGDFDSLGFVPTGNEIISHPVRKDDTDTLLAIKTGLSRGYKSFVLYGCTGNRLDHTIANLQALSFVADNDGTAQLCGEDFTATVIKNSTLRFKSNVVGNISVFAVSDRCEGVTLNGLSYPLNDSTLTSVFPLGVSNSFLNQAASISVKKGSLLVIWQGDRELIETD